MDIWYSHPNQQITLKINKHRGRKRWNVQWPYLGFSKLGQLLILSFTPKLVRLQLPPSSLFSALVLFCSSHFLQPHFSLSLSKLSSLSLYTLLFLKNGFFHSLLNPLCSLETLFVAPPVFFLFFPTSPTFLAAQVPSNGQKNHYCVSPAGFS